MNNRKSLEILQIQKLATFYIKNFLHQNLFLTGFSSSESSLSESEEFFMSQASFSLKQHIYILLKTLEDYNFYLF